MHRLIAAFALVLTSTLALPSHAYVWKGEVPFSSFLPDPTQQAVDSLLSVAPELSPDVAERAVEASYCAQDRGHAVERLVVIDMNQRSMSKRLWAFDVSGDVPRLVVHDRVAHGSGSDPSRFGVPTIFSNTPESHMTSLGLYRIAEAYEGKYGLSRRLDGMFASFNSNARDRAVVLHPSAYVSEWGVGRSQGCPAVNQSTMDALEDAGLDNAVMWIDGPDPTLEKKVSDCAANRRARLFAARAASPFQHRFPAMCSPPTPSLFAAVFA